MMFSQMITNVLSLILSAILTVGSALGGAMGGFFSLEEKKHQVDLLQTHATYTLEFDISALESLLGEAVMLDAETLSEFSGLSLTFDAIIDNTTDTSFMKVTCVMPDGSVEEEEIYLQPDAIAVSPSLAKKVLNNRIYSFDYDGSLYPVYEKYFDGRRLVLTMPKKTVQASTMLNNLVMGEEDAASDILPEITALAQLLLPCASVCYTTVEKDGVTAYRMYLNGNRVFDVYDAILQKMVTPEYLTASTVLEAKLTGKSPDPETFLASQLETVSEMRSEIAPYLTGSTQQTEDSQELLPLLASSYLDTLIYEKDGAICEEATLVISDGNATFLKLVAASEERAYDGVVPTIASLPVESRVEINELRSKAAYEHTHETGVDFVFISWTAGMTGGELNLSDAYFIVGKENEDPVSYDDFQYHMYTDAMIIDDRSYLPLRQLMESAGYDVTWDPEQRRAYVEVDSEPIEMTGVIVNDRTYVKVRDFEKLGAKVFYDEMMLAQTSDTDFVKVCAAVIAFSPEITAMLEEGPAFFALF